MLGAWNHRHFVFYAVVSATLGAVLIVCSCSQISPEADLQAQHFWKSTFAKCGDAYFQLGFGVTELQDASYTVHNFPLSDADKLNGLEWNGRIEIHSKAHRDWWGGNGRPGVYVGSTNLKYWTSWEDGDPTDRVSAQAPMFISLTKKKGLWYFASSSRSPLTNNDPGNYRLIVPPNEIEASKYNPIPVDCSQMPQS
jgi:hypothetical protein